MPKKLTRDEFIAKAKVVHGDKYDYSNVEYLNSHAKVCVICPTHGEFLQTPNKHLFGQGCPKCSKEQQNKNQTKNTEYFIGHAKKVHGGKYDYTKSVYQTAKNKVRIICPEHGEFWQTPSNHLIGQGCPKCATNERNQSNTYSTSEFIERALNVHKGEYDYSKVKYSKGKEKIIITCPIHGDFLQTPTYHLQGGGCPECKKDKLKRIFGDTTKEFVEKARKIHGSKYDYSKVVYTNSHNKVCIICPTHGEFWQRPSHHTSGIGCPRCHESKLEREIAYFLQERGIFFIPQYSPDWLGKQSVDFYLPEYNIAIECQGVQHFNPNRQFDGLVETYHEQVLRDQEKLKKCEKNGVVILYYSNLGIKYPYKVFEDKDKLFQEIITNYVHPS